jgi:hypothetical protein
MTLIMAKHNHLSAQLASEFVFMSRRHHRARLARALLPRCLHAHQAFCAKINELTGAV